MLPPWINDAFWSNVCFLHLLETGFIRFFALARVMYHRQTGSTTGSDTELRRTVNSSINRRERTNGNGCSPVAGTRSASVTCFRTLATRIAHGRPALWRHWRGVQKLGQIVSFLHSRLTKLPLDWTRDPAHTRPLCVDLFAFFVCVFANRRGNDVIEQTGGITSLSFDKRAIYTRLQTEARRSLTLSRRVSFFIWYRHCDFFWVRSCKQQCLPTWIPLSHLPGGTTLLCCANTDKPRAGKPPFVD